MKQKIYTEYIVVRKNIIKNRPPIFMGMFSYMKDAKNFVIKVKDLYIGKIYIIEKTIIETERHIMV